MHHFVAMETMTPLVHYWQKHFATNPPDYVARQEPFCSILVVTRAIPMDLSSKQCLIIWLHGAAPGLYALSQAMKL
jgi:hypothetical protein